MKRVPIKGYEGYYEIDDLGTVYSVDRYITIQCKYNSYQKFIPGQIIKPYKTKCGYLLVHLSGEDKQYHGYSVHRLVAEAFIPNPNNLPQVNHKDEDKTNNTADNLEWCTAQYNTNYGTGKERSTEGLKKHYREHGSHRTGKPSYNRKPMYGKRIEDKEWTLFPSLEEASRITGTSEVMIRDVARGKRKQSKGYVYKYAPKEKRARI